MLLENYIKQSSKPLPPYFDTIIEKCTGNKAMICGPVLGQFLAFLVQLKKPNRILEIGTFEGYSTLCLALYAQKHTEIITIEKEKTNVEKAKKHFKMYAKEKNIDIMIGDVFDCLKNIKGNFDFIFLDAGKKQTTQIYEECLALLNTNAIMVVDNALYNKEVLDINNTHPYVQGMRNFNKHITEDTRVTNVLLNIRDGIQLISKK